MAITCLGNLRQQILIVEGSDFASESSAEIIKTQTAESNLEFLIR